MTTVDVINRELLVHALNEAGAISLTQYALLMMLFDQPGMTLREIREQQLEEDLDALIERKLVKRVGLEGMPSSHYFLEQDCYMQINQILRTHEEDKVDAMRITIYILRKLENGTQDGHSEGSK